MVKIAYCLYGQPRNYSEGFKNIKKFVGNYDVDFYYHTWTLSNENETYHTSEYRNVNVEYLKYDKDIINKINLLYKPKAFLHEESRFFNVEKSDFFLNSIAYLNTSEHNKKGFRISNTLSRYYSQQQVRNLLYETIEKEKISYDFVITSRFDFLNKININLDNIDNQKIYVSNILIPRYIFADAILILNVETFLKLFNLYDNLPNLINNEEVNSLVKSYNETLIIVNESLLFSNYLYHYKNITNVEYINLPDFR
jgi:hypothetical protein